MRKLAIAVSVVLSLMGAHAVLADQHKAGGGPVKGEISQAVETQATVMAIDQKKRMVTLKSPEGNESTFHVDKRVRNLAQVKVGDVIQFAYVQHVAWQVRKPGEGAASSDVQTEGVTVRSQSGERPAGGVGQRVTFTATIEAIDLEKGTVTLKGPRGNSETIKARNPANLKKAKVGDVLDITYTEAVGIKVVAAPK